MGKKKVLKNTLTKPTFDPTQKLSARQLQALNPEAYKAIGEQVRLDSIQNIPGYTEAKAKSKPVDSTMDLSPTDIENLQDELGREEKLQEMVIMEDAELKEKQRLEQLAPKNKVEELTKNSLAPELGDEYQRKKKELEAFEKRTYNYNRNKIYKELEKDNTKVKDGDFDDFKSVKGLLKAVRGSAMGAAGAIESFLDHTESAIGAGYKKIASKRFSSAEEKKYEELQDAVNRIELPIKKKMREAEQAESDNFNKQYGGRIKTLSNQINSAIEKEVGDHNMLGGISFSGNGDSKSLIKEKQMIEHIQEYNKDILNRYDDGINGSGFWKGLARDPKSTLTVGLSDSDNTEIATEVIKKAKEAEKGGQPLSDLESQYLRTLIRRQDAMEAGLSDNSLYEVGDGVRQSLMFMAEMAAVNRVTGGAGTLMGGLRSTALKSSGIRSLVGMAPAVGTGLKAVGGFVKDVGTQAVATTMTPSAYLKAGTEYASSGQNVDAFDDEGNQTGQISVVSDAKKAVLARNMLKSSKLLEKDITDKTKELEEYFKENEETNPELEDELEDLYRKRENLANNTSKLIGKDGKLNKKEISGVDAILKGYSQVGVERLAETMGGALADKAFGVIGKAAVNNKYARALSKTKVGSAANKAGKFIDESRLLIDNKLANSKVGALTKAYTNAAGPGKIVHSLPAEMAEEIMVQLTPQYMEDYSKQLDELATPEFYTQVALSTLAIGGFTRAAGMLGMTKNMLNKEYREAYIADNSKRNNLKNLYRNINNAVTDEQFAKDIAMATLGTMHDVGDYQARIAELRNEKAEDMEGMSIEERKDLADKMEKSSFFNFAVQAIETGTEKDFQKALTAFEKREGVSDAAKEGISNSKKLLSELKIATDKYRNNINFEEVVNKHIQKSILENTLREAEKDRDSFLEKELVDNEIGALMQEAREKNNLDHAYDLDTMSFSRMTTNPAILNYIAILSDHDEKIKHYIERIAMINESKEQLKQLEKDLAYETNVDNAKDIRARELEKFKNKAIEQVTEENRDETIAALEAQGVATPEVINTINETLTGDAYVRDLIGRHNVAQQAIEDLDSENLDHVDRTAEENAPYIAERKRLSEEFKIVDVELEEFIARKEREKKEKEDEEKRVQEEIANKEKEAQQKKVEQVAKNKKKDLEEVFGDPEDADVEVQPAANAIGLDFLLGTGSGTGENTGGRKGKGAGKNPATPPPPAATPDDIQRNTEENIPDDLFSPVEISDDNAEQRKKIDTLKNVMSSMAKSGLKPDLEGIVSALRNVHGNSRQIEKNFNLIAVAYQEAFGVNLTEDDLTDVYENHFGNQDAILELAGALSEVEESSVSVVAAKQSTGTVIDVPGGTPIGDIIEGAIEVPVYEEEVNSSGYEVTEHTKRNYKEVGLKLGGVLGTEYVQEEQGKVTTAQEVNEEALPFIDYRNLRPGSKVEFKFNFKYLLDPGNTMSRWDNLEALNLDGKDMPKRVKMTVEDFLLDMFKGNPELNTWDKIEVALKELDENFDTNSPLFSNEEFIKYLPIGTVNNNLTPEFDEAGQPILEDNLLQGGLNDYYWFNTSNVALYKNKAGQPLLAEREKRIEENKRINLEARKAMLLNGGNLQSTVLEKTDKRSNQLLVPEGQTHSKVFQPLSEAFDGVDNFKEHSTIGVMIGSNFSSGKDVNGKQISPKIKGVTLTSKNIVNFDQIIKNSKNKNLQEGGIFYFYQSGLNSDGDPIFVGREVISNHESLKDEFKKVNDITNLLYFKLFGEGVSDVQRKKISDAFYSKFGFHINNEKAFNEFRVMYPDKKSKDSSNYRQLYDVSAMGKKKFENIPDLKQFADFKDFLGALFSNEAMPTITKEEAVLGNLHTNIVFTPITNNGETIYTDQSQPYAMFSQNFPTASPVKEKKKLEDKNSSLVTLRDSTVERIETTTDSIEKEALENKLESIEKQLKKNGVDTEELKQAVVSSTVESLNETHSELERTQIIAETYGVDDITAVEDISEHIMKTIQLNADYVISLLESSGDITKDCN